MRGRAGIHEPITTAPICAGVGVGVEGMQQRRVDLRRRGHAVVAWRPDVLRRGEEGLVSRWSWTQDTGVRSPGHWHGVGVDDSSPGVLAHGPGRRGHERAGHRYLHDRGDAGDLHCCRSRRQYRRCRRRR